MPRDQSGQITRKMLISDVDYQAMHDAQNGVCAICFEPETNVSKFGKVHALSVDHDHRRGVVRALLCARCNRAIGQLKDRPELAARMAHYLLDR